MRGPGSVVCPECGRLVEIGEPSCPNCGRWQPSLYGLAPILQRTFGNLEVTTMILWTCVILYAIALVLDPSAVLGGRGMFSLLSPSFAANAQLGMTGSVYQLTFSDGRVIPALAPWWTNLSAVYLHGGLLHIFFNMLWLRNLGPLLEREFGPGRFFILYTAAGVGGFVLSNVFSGAPTVGASGAIFGMLGATIVIARAHGGEWGQWIGQQAMMYAVLLFAFGFISPVVNNWAHGGGFVVGGAMAWIFLRSIDRAEGPITQISALLLGVGTLASFLASFISARF